MKTMCSPSYNSNGFEATHALEPIAGTNGLLYYAPYFAC